LSGACLSGISSCMRMSFRKRLYATTPALSWSISMKNFHHERRDASFSYVTSLRLSSSLSLSTSSSLAATTLCSASFSFCCSALYADAPSSRASTICRFESSNFFACKVRRCDCTTSLEAFSVPRTISSLSIGSHSLREP